LLIIQGKERLRTPDNQKARDGEGFATTEIDLWLSRAGSFGDSDTFKRSVLANYCGLPPDVITFRVGEHGKPELDQNDFQGSFNLSHSGDWIVCAVSSGADVGVDIESMRRTPDFLKLGRRFYHPLEFEVLSALPEERRADYFFDLWTLKEASVKARGGALAPNLPEREFELLSEQQPPVLIQHLPGQSAQFFRCLFDPVPHYRLALCAAVPVAHIPCIRLHVLESDESWKEVAVTLRASSTSQRDG
jgi:4'-phosphopantetheinyl transferase